MQVETLTSTLDQERGYQEQTRMKIQSIEQQRDSAKEREAQLRSDLSATRFKLEAAEAQLETLKEQVSARTVLVSACMQSRRSLRSVTIAVRPAGGESAGRDQCQWKGAGSY